MKDEGRNAWCAIEEFYDRSKAVPSFILHPSSFLCREQEWNMRKYVVLTSVIVLVSVSAYAGKATLYRDTWGVPHIYADTLVEGAYVLGYAQAEDRLEDLYKSIRTATGTMAEAFGDEGDNLEIDYVMRLVRNAELCQELWERSPASLRDIAERFMQGVQAYVDEHPEKKPSFAN
jgi:acyl-homoserine lactone acylase PvdQ